MANLNASSLVVAPCSHDAARFAVENWHYSKCLPSGKLIKFGVWEDGNFIGCVIISRGASPFLGKSLDLDQTEICELTRVAMTTHRVPVSQVVAVALAKLKESNPKMRAIVSFADPKEGHVGGIYKAGNWIYTGQSNEVIEYFIDGRWRHTKSVYHHPERTIAPKRVAPSKYRYVYPLDKQMRRIVEKQRLPYPTA
jgi:hypothetical protein